MDALIHKDGRGRNLEERKQICDACIKYLVIGGSNPEILSKIHGQLSLMSPWTLQIVEPQFFLPLIKNGTLKHKDLHLWYWDFKFGYTTAETGNVLVQKADNGQFLAVPAHYNNPLYFNRLLSEFTGPALLIGGTATGCECSKGHDFNKFYTVDLRNEHTPDLVMHAGYLPHLYVFPTNRFDLVWLEHCTVRELGGTIIAAQYDRFLKPKGVIVFQSNLYYTVPEIKAEYDFCVKHFEPIFKYWRYQVTKPVIKPVIRFGKNCMYVECIAVKAVHTLLTNGTPYPDLEDHILRQRIPLGDKEFKERVKWARKLMKGE